MNNIDGDDYAFIFKIVIIGESGVGKTQLLNRFTHNKFNFESRSTIGVEFGSKKVETKDKKIVKVQIWDTAGQEKYQAISKVYYQGAIGINQLKLSKSKQGAMVVYDITRKVSLEKSLKWLQELRDNSSPYIQVLLVGNKCDLENDREVAINVASDFAKENSIAFIETSAKNSTNVEEAFKILVEQIYQIKTTTNGLCDDASIKQNNGLTSGANSVGTNIILGTNATPKEMKKSCC